MNDHISIIIPAFNAEKYIHETVDSVLKQTHNNLELIVVDDGSTDNTAIIIETFCKKDGRVKLIRQINSGVSVARNIGFSNSKGNHIAFLDADDVLKPEHLKLLLAQLKSDDDLGLIHSDCQVIDSNTKKENIFYNGQEGYLLDNMLLGGKWVNGTSGSLIKKEVLETVGGFDKDLSNAADLEFFLRVANKYKIGRVSKITWYYRMHSNNMHSNILLLEKDALMTYKKADVNKLFKSNKFRRICYSRMYFMLAGSFWKEKKNISKTLYYLFKSITYYPQSILYLAFNNTRSQE